MLPRQHHDHSVRVANIFRFIMNSIIPQFYSLSSAVAIKYQDGFGCTDFADACALAYARFATFSAWPPVRQRWEQTDPTHGSGLG